VGEPLRGGRGGATTGREKGPPPSTQPHPFPTPHKTTQVRAESSAAGHINPAIKKDVEKVVDTLKVADLPNKAVFCRCWRSAKFPYCDGAHAKHNAATGDNVGPLIVDKSE
jgi:CDGSH-type Zn-finger protein